ncbi:hypothetical protein RINTHH_15160 [Richelia intracellularis HH01]|jgi:hypothetical protein|uniref:Uncharacterized protein n=1 Tax=Richelia intracellularis HH01 TaxID=1165094 RepID=M1X5X2_9NOST|nr:hypothetical protein [Richelia intracellularis]CCH67671.1 hypothetical protein RINTHH_15160 [Richelia intracellularis HH01]
MVVFRQHIIPFLVIIAFLFALVVVSARIFLPSDMAKPAPIVSEFEQSKLYIPLSKALH